MSSGVCHYILVDYDNLVKNTKSYDVFCGPAILNILRLLDENGGFFSTVKPLSKVNIFLYGGWYQDAERTRLADKITQAINQQGHSSCAFRDQIYMLKNGTKIRVVTDLKYELFSIHGVTFFGTLRKYSPSFQLKSGRRPCCDDGDFFLKALQHFHDYGTCLTCGKNLRQNIFSYSQKMVDTMICCDLFTLCRNPDNFVAVVSSDDDLLPPIFQQSMVSENVYHVLTKETASHCYETFYLPRHPPFYKQVYWN